MFTVSDSEDSSDDSSSDSDSKSSQEEEEETEAENVKEVKSDVDDIGMNSKTRKKRRISESDEERVNHSTMQQDQEKEKLVTDVQG